MRSPTRFSARPRPGDIGRHFPDTDPQYDGRQQPGAARARGRDRARGAATSSRTSTRSSSRSVPKLAPHVDRIRATLAAALGVGVDAVSVKGKTNEGMGEVGPRRRHGRPRGRAAAIACNGIRHSSFVIRRHAPALRPEPHRPPARRQRPHGVVQLAARARTAADVRAAHRGHRSRALDGSNPSGRSSTTCAGWGSTGTRAPIATAAMARTASPSGWPSIGRTPTTARATATPTTASARQEQLEADRQAALGGRSAAALRRDAAARSIPRRRSARRDAAGEIGGHPLPRAGPSRRSLRRRRARPGDDRRPTSSATRCCCARMARPPTTSPSSSTTR